MGKSVQDLEQEIARLRDEKNRALDLVEEVRKEQRELKPSADFVQLDRATMRAIRELTSKSPTATKILMLMAEKMNKQNAIMITNKAIEGITGASAPTITKSLALLKKENWIKVMKVGTSNAYFVNSAVFWTSKLKNKQFAEFTANIITSESEQPDSFEKWDDIKLRYMPLVDHNPDQERISLSGEDIPPPDQKDLGLD
jgi:Fe2+ or Zn2+ uptake regulation protein